MAGSSITALAKAAGLSDPDLAYLKAKGYDTVAILARAARDDDEFLARILEPFVTGVKIDETNHKAAGDKNLLEARFLVLSDEAKNARKSELAAAAAPPQATLTAPKTVLVLASSSTRRTTRNRSTLGKTSGRLHVSSRSASSRALTTSYSASSTSATRRGFTRPFTSAR